MVSTAADLCEALVDILGELGDATAAASARLLLLRLDRPEAFVTVVGETSTGKSTLVNAHLKRPILPTAARPTSGTVVHVTCDAAAPFDLSAVYRDATQETLTPDRFTAFALAPPGELLRLEASVAPRVAGTQDLHLIDTPGFNSVVAEHEEILRAFLPDSDAVIFVAGYRSGFGQVDQDLCDAVRTATTADPSMPVLLVINRAPEGVTTTDRRVREIVGNAADSFRRVPEVHIVRSVPPNADGTRPPPPDAEALWRRVRAVVDDPTRVEALRRKLVAALAAMTDEADERLARRLDVLDDEQAAVDEQRLDLEDGLARSEEAVRAAMTRLGALLASTARRSGVSVADDLHREIGESEKWFGQAETRAWVEAHAVPATIRDQCKRLEGIVETELERLDRELDEIANTTVHRIQKRARLRSDASVRIAESVARSFGKRAAGAALTNSLVRMGGVGGVAAGVGNLVKMAVKRLGQIAGTTFSKEVYRSIGRVFTKRVVSSLAVVLSVAVDAAFFTWDANRWQAQLSEKVRDAVERWGDETAQDIQVKQVPAMLQASLETVAGVYRPLLKDLATNSELSPEDMAARRANLLAARASTTASG